MIIYLTDKGVVINDSILFEQIVNLNSFWLKLTEMKSSQINYAVKRENFKHQKFLVFVSQYHRRMQQLKKNFSLMKKQWTDSRNRLITESLKR